MRIARPALLLLGLAAQACVVDAYPVPGETGPPGEDGANGKDGTNGASPFSYVDPAAMTDIYYSGGRVGVGTPNPTESLDVNGSIHLVGNIATPNWTTHAEWYHLNETSAYSPGYWKLPSALES